MTAPTHTGTRHINQPYLVKKAAVNRKYKYFCGIFYLALFMRKDTVKMNAP